MVSVLGQSLQTDGFSTKTTLPPISVALDFAVSKRVSIGGYVGITKDKLLYTDYDYFFNTEIAGIQHVIIGMRGLYHFKWSQKFDTYIGLMLGCNAAKYEAIVLSAPPVQLRAYSCSFLFGRRYRFSDHVGVFAELCYGVSLVNIGLNF